MGAGLRSFVHILAVVSVCRPGFMCQTCKISDRFNRAVYGCWSPITTKRNAGIVYLNVISADVYVGCDSRHYCTRQQVQVVSK